MKGSAPGKVILLGEHGVVYGHPALVGSIPKRLEVDVQPDEKGPRIELPDGAKAPEELERAAGAMAIELGHLPTFKVKVKSELPFAGGLGSSAALGVALARALCAELKIACPPEKAMQLAMHIETVLHGTPSGVDPAACAFGGVLLFAREPFRLETVAPMKPLHVVVAMSGVARGTRSTVQPLAERRMLYPEAFDPLLAQLGEIASKGRVLAEEGDLENLGVELDIAHGVLSALGLSCPELETAVNALKRGGALGAKLTGAGGGGAAVGLALDEAHAAQIAAKVSAAGMQAFAALLGGES